VENGELFKIRRRGTRFLKRTNLESLYGHVCIIVVKTKKKSKKQGRSAKRGGCKKVLGESLFLNLRKKKFSNASNAASY